MLCTLLSILFWNGFEFILERVSIVVLKFVEEVVAFKF